jgi:hypothetical protein
MDFAKIFPGFAHVASEWKHTLRPLGWHRDETILNVVVIKDPLFWIKSMRRQRYDIPFYTNDITARFEYQGQNFDGLASLWNSFAALYAHGFNSRNTVVLRNKDLLFHWEEVMRLLDAGWIPGTAPRLVESERTTDVAKEEDARSRNLSEAKDYYGDPRNRVSGWTAAEMSYLRRALDFTLMERFGYDAF